MALFEKLMVHNNPDVKLVIDNEYTRFGYILPIHSQYFEPKPNFDVNQGP